MRVLFSPAKFYSAKFHSARFHSARFHRGRPCGAPFFAGLVFAGLAVFMTMVLAGAPARAELAVYELTLKDHRFSPEELHIPAGEKVKLIVHNQDSTPEEFESYELNREKVVGAGKSIKLFIGPLKAGVYEFFGEFNIETARGRIIVK
jgi:heme/copper-type cytochrome/quinol oxidase subunit 2